MGTLVNTGTEILSFLQNPSPYKLVNLGRRCFVQDFKISADFADEMWRKLPLDYYHIHETSITCFVEFYRLKSRL